MCFIVPQNGKLRIAKRNIYVDKFCSYGNKEVGKYYPLFAEHSTTPYEIGTLYRARKRNNIIFGEDGNLIRKLKIVKGNIHCGIHTFVSGVQNPYNRYARYRLRGYIPKGTQYCYNKNEREYVSLQFMPIKVIEEN